VTATAVRPDDPTVPLPAGGGRLETDLGVTTVAPLVCEKIAARAAAEVDGVEVVATGLSRLAPWSSSPSAGATADVRGHSVSVDLTVDVRYPLPVATTARLVRERVTARLGELAGLAVRDVTVTVAGLPDECGAHPPRVR
jgi:uncharacterized alkaline shock family protein YloU